MNPLCLTGIFSATTVNEIGTEKPTARAKKVRRTIKVAKSPEKEELKAKMKIKTDEINMGLRRPYR
jgi:hypothetical protein